MFEVVVEVLFVVVMMVCLWENLLLLMFGAVCEKM